MKNNLLFIKIIFVTLIFGLQTAFAQSGGTYQITQTVLPSGEKSSGGAYSIENTTGQPVAGGFLQGASYSLYSGFWTPPTFAPTAANVSVGGRVTTIGGQGIRNVQIILTGSNGVIRTAQTATFGYYRFADVPAGESYVLTISSRRYIFSNPTRILNVLDELTDVDFVAEN
jgi:hypothetical protein